MIDRTIRLHTFCSIKGGVGKSTLAVLCAKLLAARGRVPMLLDCDLSGTSLADGLRLRAPKVELLKDGCLDLEAAPTGELYTVEESRQLRAKRREVLQDEEWEDRLRPPPYLNDPLNYVYHTDIVPRSEGLLWRHEREDGVLYFPSSSTEADVVQSIEWLFGEPFDWSRCLLTTLDRLAQEMPALTDVVIDLPTGIWGVSHEMLVIVSMLLLGKPLPEDYPSWNEGPVRWIPNPFMVTSRDPNDLVPAIEYVARHKIRIPTFKLIVNRAPESMAALQAVMRERLGSLLDAVGLDERFDQVAEMDALQKLFWDGDISMTSVPQSLVKTLRLEEGTC